MWFLLCFLLSPGPGGHAVLGSCVHSGEPQGTGRYETDTAGSKGADEMGQPAQGIHVASLLVPTARSN